MFRPRHRRAYVESVQYSCFAELTEDRGVASLAISGDDAPPGVRFPLITLRSEVGAKAANNSISDLYRMPSFGVIRYFMRRFGFSLGPIILSAILSRLLDDKWRWAVDSEREDGGRVLEGVLMTPLTQRLFLVVIPICGSLTLAWAWERPPLFGPGDRGTAQ